MTGETWTIVVNLDVTSNVCLCLCVFVATTHLFSNTPQDGSVVTAPLFTDTTVGGNVILSTTVGDNVTHNMTTGDHLTHLTTNVTNIINEKSMKIENHQKKGQHLWLIL